MICVKLSTYNFTVYITIIYGLCDKTKIETTPTRHRHDADGGGPRRGRSHQEENPCRGSHPHLGALKGATPDGEVSHQRRTHVEGQIRTDDGVSTAVYTMGLRINKATHHIPSTCLLVPSVGATG